MWSKLYYTQYTPLSNVYINTKIKLVILHAKIIINFQIKIYI